MRDAHGKGYRSKVPHFNSISTYLESEVLTPYLKMLIEENSLPLREIERDFAVDSSGSRLAVSNSGLERDTRTRQSSLEQAQTAKPSEPEQIYNLVSSAHCRSKLR